MKKIIKIGFPIVCIVLIGGTFYLLNKFQKEINANQKISSKSSNSINNSESEQNDNEEILQNLEENNTFNEKNADTMYATSIEGQEENKRVESENEKAVLEIAKNYYGEYDNVYYTNEGKEDDKYIVAVRDKETTTAKIYYLIDAEQKTVEIYY